MTEDRFDSDEAERAIQRYHKYLGTKEAERVARFVNYRAPVKQGEIGKVKKNVKRKVTRILEGCVTRKRTKSMNANSWGTVATRHIATTKAEAKRIVRLRSARKWRKKSRRGYLKRM